MFEQLGITPIRLALPFRLNHVNCYMAEGEDGWRLLDTGLNNEQTRTAWDKLLDGKKVSDIWVSHYHPDHFGCSGWLQRKTGARVSMTATDAHSGIHVWEDDFILEIRKHYVEAGVPEDVAVAMTGNTKEFTSRVQPYPTIDHEFQNGEKLVFGRYEYEVIFAPGHADGQVVFYNQDKNVLLSTDHILQKITPNIAYWFHGLENPLGAYLDSLRDMKKLDADFVIPGHGKPFYGANDRIDEIIEHHGNRLEKTYDSIVGESTIYDVCGKLFDGGLTVHETRFALGETIAHLEYLRHAGEIERTLRNGIWIYQK